MWICKSEKRTFDVRKSDCPIHLKTRIVFPNTYLLIKKSICKIMWVVIDS